METSTLLTSEDAITKLVRDMGIQTWEDLCSHMESLPYGRNSNRHDLSLPLRESKGTCSSKHALLKTVADLNAIPNIELVLGIYKMNNTNTPGIVDTLEDCGLPYLPEAHCYLKIDGTRLDFTSTRASIDRIESEIMQELAIQPEQVSEFKVDHHQNFLRRWLSQNHIELTLEEVWDIRERCIARLSD